MAIQYLTDEHGRRTAVVVPMEKWEELQALLSEAEETLTPEEAIALEADWEAYKADPSMAKPLARIKRELLGEGGPS